MPKIEEAKKKPERVFRRLCWKHIARHEQHLIVLFSNTPSFESVLYKRVLLSECIEWTLVSIQRHQREYLVDIKLQWIEISSLYDDDLQFWERRSKLSIYCIERNIVIWTGCWQFYVPAFAQSGLIKTSKVKIVKCWWTWSFESSRKILFLQKNCKLEIEEMLLASVCVFEFVLMRKVKRSSVSR